MTRKTRHWMIFLPFVAVLLRLATAAIRAGVDGRTVLHTHVTSRMHTTPFPARLWAAIRGRDSTRDYACPLEATPVESEETTWPR